MKNRTKIAVCAFILIISFLIIYVVNENDNSAKIHKRFSYAERVSPQRLDVDLNWYRLYHPNSNNDDVIRFIRSLFALWIYSDNDFVEYCNHFPKFQGQSVESQFKEILLGSDVLDLERFGPLQVGTNEGRLDFFVKGVDRHLWIESFAIKDGDVSKFADLGKDEIWRKFIGELNKNLEIAK